MRTFKKIGQLAVVFAMAAYVVAAYMTPRDIVTYDELSQSELSDKQKTLRDEFLVDNAYEVFHNLETAEVIYRFADGTYEPAQRSERVTLEGEVLFSAAQKHQIAYLTMVDAPWWMYGKTTVQQETIIATLVSLPMFLLASFLMGQTAGIIAICFLAASGAGTSYLFGSEAAPPVYLALLLFVPAAALWLVRNLPEREVESLPVSS